MDCMNLQALGDSSDSECSNASSTFSDKDCTAKENPVELIEVDRMVLEEDPYAKVCSISVTIKLNKDIFYFLISKKKDYLYEKYKEGLKLLSKQEFSEAEALFQLLLKNPLLESVSSNFLHSSKKNIFKFHPTQKIKNKDDEELEIEFETDKELVKLKYILLKNLASINSSTNNNFSEALNYLIQVTDAK